MPWKSPLPPVADKVAARDPQLMFIPNVVRVTWPVPTPKTGNVPLRAGKSVRLESCPEPHDDRSSAGVNWNCHVPAKLSPGLVENDSFVPTEFCGVPLCGIPPTA